MFLLKIHHQIGRGQPEHNHKTGRSEWPRFPEQRSSLCRGAVVTLGRHCGKTQRNSNPRTVFVIVLTKTHTQIIDKDSKRENKKTGQGGPDLGGAG